MSGNVVSKVVSALRKAVPWPGAVTSSGQKHPHQKEILMAVAEFLGADGYGSDDTQMLHDLRSVLWFNDDNGDYLTDYRQQKKELIKEIGDLLRLNMSLARSDQERDACKDLIDEICVDAGE